MQAALAVRCCGEGAFDANPATPHRIILPQTPQTRRAFGIDFFSVLSRGSQYRVESLMVRLAHSQNYLAISPSREQVRAGAAPPAPWGVL